MEDNKLPYNDFDKKEQDSKRMIVIVVISILLGVNGLLLWQFFDKKNHLDEVSLELKTTISEKESLQAQLDSVKSELNRVNELNASLHDQMLAKDNEIQSKISQIEKLLKSGDAAKLQVAKNEIDRLKKLNENYMASMDTLRTENANLAAINSTLKNNLKSEQGKVQSLSQENMKLSTKVAIGSVLKAVDVHCSAIKYRSNGSELETSRASSTNGIKTCMRLLENFVTDRGTKDAYLRVLSPDGAVMSTSSETFLYNNQPTLYTSKESFEYDNKEMSLCLFWKKGSAYIKGHYTIEIYIEGNMVGSTSIVLK